MYVAASPQARAATHEGVSNTRKFAGDEEIGGGPTSGANGSAGLVRDWVDGGEFAVVFHITGTHQGSFMGQLATGNVIDVAAMNNFRIENGKINAIEAFFNPLHLLHPLGLAPTMDGLELGPSEPLADPRRSSCAPGQSFSPTSTRWCPAPSLSTSPRK